jgi:hypothetical protein
VPRQYGPAQRGHVDFEERAQNGGLERPTAGASMFLSSLAARGRVGK